MDRELVNIYLARRLSSGDPKLPKSTRLSPKPLKSMPWDNPEGSHSQPSGASVQKGYQSVFKPAQRLFRGTPLHDTSFNVVRLPTKSSLAEFTAHTAVHSGTQRTQPHTDAFPTSSAARSPISTRAGGKDDGSWRTNSLKN